LSHDLQKNWHPAPQQTPVKNLTHPPVKFMLTAGSYS